MRPVNLTPMAHSKNQHEQHCVGDLIDDPVVPGAYSPFTVTTDKLTRRRRPGILGEQDEHTVDAPAGCWI